MRWSTFSFALCSSLALAASACIDTDGAGDATVTQPGVIAEPVTWTNLIGASATGNDLTRTAGGWGWNAGASSTRGLNGSGYAEFAVPATPGYAMFGLSNGDTNQDYADIDYAFYTYPGSGSLLIVEGGNVVADLGAYTPGELLQITVSGTEVAYVRGNVTVYTSATAATLPLRADTSLLLSGARVDDAMLAGTLVDVAPPVSTEPVVWRNVYGVDATGNDLTKTGSLGWNAGASSTRGIEGSGFAEFTVPAVDGWAMFGLSSDDQERDYADIDFAFYTYRTTGQLLVVEGGNVVAYLDPYVAGETLRVSLDAGVVSYRRNGAIVYTSAATPAATLVVDTSLLDAGAQVQDAVLGGNVVDVVTATPEDVTWRNVINAIASGNDLTKSGSWGWNAGASSTRAIVGDGYVELTVPASPSYAMVGLSDTDATTDYAEIDHAFYTYPFDGRLYVIENGAIAAKLDAYVPGERLRIAVIGSTVTYRRNGLLVYTSTHAPTRPLRVDASLLDDASSVLDAQLAGDLGDVTVPSPPAAVAWRNAVGVAVDGADLTKTDGWGWNAGASSTRAISGDGYVEVVVPSAPQYAMVGLSNGDASQDYAEIDYAFYTYAANGHLLIIENGALVEDLGPYTPGETLRVSVTGSTVTYARDGVVVFTSSAAPTRPLLVDTSLLDTGAQVLGTTIAGDLIDL